MVSPSSPTPQGSRRQVAVIGTLMPHLHVAFISLTLGFLQPIVLATAATVGVLGLRRLGVSPAAGMIEGLVLVVAYELATTLLLAVWDTRDRVDRLGGVRAGGSGIGRGS
jgi:hypothetical protein